MVDLLRGTGVYDLLVGLVLLTFALGRLISARRFGPTHGARSAAACTFATMLVVAGTRLAREDVLTLAGLLTRSGSDRTARILLEALVHGRVFVALTTEDKECLLAVLDHPPVELSRLRGALFDELNWQRAGLVPPPRSRGIGAMTARSKDEPANVAWV